MVEPPIWKICASQIGSFPQIGMNIKSIWNHHPVRFYHRKWDLGSTLGQYYATIAFLQQSGIRHHHHPNCWSRPDWLVEVSGATCFWLTVPVRKSKSYSRVATGKSSFSTLCHGVHQTKHYSSVHFWNLELYRRCTISHLKWYPPTQPKFL